MLIHFLFGSETGTAEFLCDDLAAQIDDGSEYRISSMGEVDPGKMEAGTFYVIVAATFGSGETAGTGRTFVERLHRSKPDLSEIRFALFGLGDTTFDETYNHGSQHVMDGMLACNARMVGERGLFNAASPDMPEDVAIPWMQGILSRLKTESA